MRSAIAALDRRARARWALVGLAILIALGVLLPASSSMADRMICTGN